METIKLHLLRETSNPRYQRICNLEGDWTHYLDTEKNVPLPAVNHVLRYYPKGEAFYNYLLSKTPKEAKEILEKAGNKGSRVHDAIKDVINGSEIGYYSLYPDDLSGKPSSFTTEEWKCILAWQSFAERFQPEKIFVENTVGDDRCVGTADAAMTFLLTAGDKIRLNPKISFGRFNGGITTVKRTARVKVIPDWKSSSGIWPEYAAQVAKYWSMLDDKTIQYIAIVRLGTDHSNGKIDGAGYEILLWDKDHIKDHLKAFDAAYYFFKLLNPDPFEIDQTEMPLSVKVIVPDYKPLTRKPVAKKATAKPAKSADPNAGIQRKNPASQ